MRCPKCGFHTFDHLDACKKCNADLSSYKTQKPAAVASSSSALSLSSVPPSPPTPSVFSAPVYPGSSSTSKPAYFTLVGWLCIAGAVLMFSSGGMSLAVSNVMQDMRDQMPPMPKKDLPAAFGFMETIFEFFDVLTFLQLIFAVFVLIAAIQFLRRRGWARMALEIFSWLVLTYIVGYGIFWIFSWMRLSSMMSGKGLSGFSAMFTIIIAFVVMAFWGTPTILILKVLRRREIKEYMN